jgi:hypothetical protein
MCNWVVRTHTALQVQPRHPGLPRAMVYGLYVISPGSGLSCPRRVPGLTGLLDARVAAPEPHDFTVRCRRFRPHDLHRTGATASIATRATLRDDREASLWRARANADQYTDLPILKSGIFLRDRLDNPNQLEIAREIRFSTQRARRDRPATATCRRARQPSPSASAAVPFSFSPRSSARRWS